MAASAADVWPETQRMPLQSVSSELIVSDKDAVAIDPAPLLPNSSQRQPRRISEKKKKKSRRALFSMVGLFAVAVVVGAAWRSNDRSPDVAIPMAAEKEKPAAAALVAPASSSSSSASATAPNAANAGPAGPVARGPVAIEPAAAQPEAPPKAPPPPTLPTPPQASTASAPEFGPTSPQRQVAQRQPQAKPPTSPPKQKQADKQTNTVATDEATARKPRKVPAAAAVPSAPVAATQAVPAALAAAPAVVAEAPALPSPSAVCAGLGFFARGRCMVAQCAKADYRTHSQCDAVRRQELLDEEKRNPAQLN